ncbi:hypothetical protein [Microbacterium gilvum]|uniref:DUF3168 domain-containing protein n=1 Tax=Microbacterium gilvum TaxID=1336204 RepID=A0ABP8ZPR8_9MICO
MLRAHLAALRAVLEAVALLAGKLHTAVRTTTDGVLVRENYLVVTPTMPAVRANRHTARQRIDGRSRWRFDVRVVAVTSDGVLLLTDAVRSAVGAVPVVAGRACTAITVVDPVEDGRVIHDRTSDLYYLDLTLEFWSGGL